MPLDLAEKDRALLKHDNLTVARALLKQIKKGANLDLPKLTTTTSLDIT